MLVTIDAGPLSLGTGLLLSHSLAPSLPPLLVWDVVYKHRLVPL